MRAKAWTGAVIGALLLAGCNGETASVNSAGSAAAESGGGLLGSVPSLVNVNLKDVLNDLAVRLNLDEANIPVNAQIPIQLALNVCGVTINVLAVSTGGQANCDAKTSSPELAQVVQQQIAAGGSVGGGAQGTSSAGTSGTTAGAGTTAGTGTTTGTTAGTSGSATTTGGTSTGSTTATSSGTSGSTTTGSTGGTTTGTSGSTGATAGTGSSGSTATQPR